LYLTTDSQQQKISFSLVSPKSSITRKEQERQKYNKEYKQNPVTHLEKSPKPQAREGSGA